MKDSEVEGTICVEIVSEIEGQSRSDQHLGTYFGRVDLLGGLEMEILSEGYPSILLS